MTILQKYYDDMKAFHIDKQLAQDLLENKTQLSKKDYSNEDYIIINAIVKKYQSLINNKPLNHTCFKMSDLDMEIIKQVPQGGNWENLSQETIDKSIRLQKIQKSGGRTTMYGRLDYRQPSYTITTYFNRPGSGTHIHPTQDRVITPREAARLQTFPDNHFFFGNQRDVLKQIGNAVPPNFSFQLAKSINDYVTLNNAIDLFSGAGGLYLGFKQIGVSTNICVDIDKSACTTLKLNNPKQNVLCGDITKEETKQTIYKSALSNDIDIICGGPPCQGFSLVGKRQEDDERNDLFLHYVDIVSHIKPKVFVFENVIGILSHNNGDTFKTIVSKFKEIGYNVEFQKISMEEYGIPQKRKRVIIIGVRQDINVDILKLYPQKNNSQMNVFEAINDLENKIFS